MKKFLSTLLCLLLILSATFIFTSCSTEKASASYISIDINPSIELTVDEESKVVSVYAANEDASVLLYGESGIVGSDVEDAIEKITEIAIELGYLDESNKIVGTTVSSKDAEWIKSLQEKINSKIIATAKSSGLEIETDAEGAYSIIRKLDALKAKYPDNAAVQNLSVSKFKLALSASESGELTVEAAAELDETALIELVSDTHSKIEAFATEAYNQAKQQALSIYDELSGIALDGIYGEFYIKNVFSHPTTYWYGHTYQMYKTTARGFDAIANALVFVEKIQNYSLDEAQITSVMTALGITDRTVLLDGDGKVTIDSIYAYADKKFKNTEASAELEAMKSELDAALDDAEAKVNAEIQKAVNEYKDEIDAALVTSKEAMNLIISLLPASLTSALEAQNVEYNRVIDELTASFTNGEASQAKMRECANKMNELAEEMLSKITADLSESELAEVQKMIDSRKALLDGYRDSMEETISKAEATVKSELEKIKAERAKLASGN